MARDAVTTTESAIVGGTVTGHLLLHIDGYSHIKEQLPNGRFMDSRRFVVGGHPWRIRYHPNGNLPVPVADGSDYMSILLIIDETVAIAVKARAKFTLLTKDGETTPPEPDNTATTCLGEFSKKGYGLGFILLFDMERLKKTLLDDKFTIRCDVVVSKELRVEDREAAVVAPSLATVLPSDLHRHLDDLLDSKDGTDVTSEVGGEAFRAHRYVFAARSPVFRAELFGAMKESTAAATVCVDNMEAAAFSALLLVLYTDALPVEWTDMEDEAAMAQHLLVAADRYNLERLKLLCEDKLRKHIGAGPVATMLALSEQHHCRRHKEACLVFLSSPATVHAAIETDGFDHLSRS